MSAETKETIRLEQSGDRTAIHALLEAADLPKPAPEEADVAFVVWERGREIIGCAGWEIHEGEALLRSVGVRSDFRSRGGGRRLVETALKRLSERGVTEVTLVTLDAEEFFLDIGFEPIALEEVHAPVRSSPEFRIHRCVGGHWMHRSG